MFERQRIKRIVEAMLLNYLSRIMLTPRTVDQTDQLLTLFNHLHIRFTLSLIARAVSISGSGYLHVPRPSKSKSDI